MMRRALLELCESGAAQILALAAVALLFLALCGGCKDTGVSATVGNINAPIEISESSSSINLRALFSLQGAKVWSKENSRVEMTYTNDYTNSYVYGLFEDRGVQRFGVKVLPTTDEEEAEEEPPPDGDKATAKSESEE